ncbi:hypothetical protein [Chondromyces apiculatus]|uniref:hypothetical protein n=1 Tax=Chondromyces apiculatus TaxID=51 RepID=UPI0012DD33CA|nr:hypothetical protein [Chondromyces apiculatus]
MLVNGQPLRKFTNIRTAAGVLVATAGRAGATAARPAIDLPVSIEGFKSTHPDAEPGRAPVEVGLLPLLIPWIAAYGAYSYVNTPTEDTERRFRDLAADWEAFERAGVPRPPFGFLAADHRAWVAFREAWKAGNPDVSDLAPQEATANRVRAELFQRSGDPRYGKDRNLKSTDVLETKRVLQAADTVDREVRAVTQAAQSKTANVWDAIPWQAKAGGAAVLTLFVLTLFRDLTRGLR